jgi:hypothetical protein
MNNQFTRALLYSRPVLKTYYREQYNQDIRITSKETNTYICTVGKDYSKVHKYTRNTLKYCTVQPVNTSLTSK